MKKRVLVLMLAMVMVLGVAAGCGGGGEPAASTPPSASTPASAAPSEPAAPESSAPVASEPVASAPADTGGASSDLPQGAEGSVVLITMDSMDQHWQNVKGGCEEAVADMGGTIDFQMMSPDVKDDAKQIEMINMAVAAKANVILLAANGPTAVNSALEEASAAGIKIIYVDSPADFPAEQTLATNNKAAGSTAGEEMIKALADAGVTEGKIGIVNVNASTDSVVQREEGFREALKDSGFEILETQYAEGDAAKSQEAAANFITDGVVGLYGCNEGSTVGVGNAIKEAGDDKIKGVGFDQSDNIKTLIKDGYLVCVMAQNPDQMGYQGMVSAAKLLLGESIAEKEVDTGVTVMNKDNI